MKNKILDINKFIDLIQNEQDYIDENTNAVIDLIDDLSYETVVSSNYIEELDMEIMIEASRVISAYLSKIDDNDLDKEEMNLIEKYDLESYKYCYNFMTLAERNKIMKKKTISNKDLF